MARRSAISTFETRRRWFRAHMLNGLSAASLISATGVNMSVYQTSIDDLWMDWLKRRTHTGICREEMSSLNHCITRYAYLVTYLFSPFLSPSVCRGVSVLREARIILRKSLASPFIFRNHRRVASPMHHRGYVCRLFRSLRAGHVSM